MSTLYWPAEGVGLTSHGNPLRFRARRGLRLADFAKPDVNDLRVQIPVNFADNPYPVANMGVSNNYPVPCGVDRDAVFNNSEPQTECDGCPKYQSVLGGLCVIGRLIHFWAPLSCFSYKHIIRLVAKNVNDYFDNF